MRLLAAQRIEGAIPQQELLDAYERAKDGTGVPDASSDPQITEARGDRLIESTDEPAGSLTDDVYPDGMGIAAGARLLATGPYGHLFAAQKLNAVALTEELKREFYEGLQNVEPYFKTWTYGHRVFSKSGNPMKIQANASRYLMAHGWAPAPHLAKDKYSTWFTKEGEWVIKLALSTVGCSLELVSEKMRHFVDFPGGLQVGQALIAAGYKVKRSEEAALSADGGALIKIPKSKTDKWDFDKIVKIVIQALGAQVQDVPVIGRTIFRFGACTYTLNHDSLEITIKVNYTADQLMDISRYT